MSHVSLDYLIEKHFYLSLRPNESLGDVAAAAPGIVLLFVEMPDGSAEFLIDALIAEDDVAQAARRWLRDIGPASQIGTTIVRYAAFPDLRQRIEVMDFIRLHLPGDRYT